ncbi:unnamed protein product [Umbelopsis ramanniana]
MYINSNRDRLLEDDRNSHMGDVTSTLGDNEEPIVQKANNMFHNINRIKQIVRLNSVTDNCFELPV